MTSPSTAATVDMKVLLASLGLGVDAVTGSLPGMMGARGPMGNVFALEGAGGGGSDYGDETASVDDWASGFGSPMGSSRGTESGTVRRTSKSAPDGVTIMSGLVAGGAGGSSSGRGLMTSASPARSSLGPAAGAAALQPPRSPLAQSGGGGGGGGGGGTLASAAKTLIHQGRSSSSSSNQPPGSGGWRGSDVAGSDSQIYVADESKLAVLFGPSGNGGSSGGLLPPGSPAPRLQGAGALQPQQQPASPKTVSSPHASRPLPVKPPAHAAIGGGGAPTPTRISAGSMSPTRLRSPQPPEQPQQR